MHTTISPTIPLFVGASVKSSGLATMIDTFSFGRPTGAELCTSMGNLFDELGPLRNECAGQKKGKDESTSCEQNCGVYQSHWLAELLLARVSSITYHDREPPMSHKYSKG